MQDECIRTMAFAGLRVKFHFPSEVPVAESMRTFFCGDEAEPDAEYEIRLLEQPLQITGEAAAVCRGMHVYRTREGWLRVYTPLTAEDGCQVACILRGSGKHTLYYPASRWEYYAKELHCLHLIGIEELLLQKEALLLHSSVVELYGQAVLFSGPSGIGKSTQAELWKNCLGADILNGDRCIIRKIEDVFYGCGSPWCGTSAIYRRACVPLKGIFILQKAQENRVRRLKAEAFSHLYRQCIVDGWDDVFVSQITELLSELLNRIPVYELSCRPEEAAARLAYDTLYGGDC